MKLINTNGHPAIILETLAEQKLICAVLGRIQYDTEVAAGYSEQSQEDSKKVFEELYDICSDAHDNLDVDVTPIYFRKPYIFVDTLMTGEIT